MPVTEVKSNKAWRLECEELRQNNWELCNAIIEYHDAVQAVLNFTRDYLNAGGDALTIPERWNDLDLARQGKYSAMLKAAKGAA